MIYAKPGAEYTAVLNAGVPGLVGTLTVQLEKADGTTAVAPTTAGIVEVEPTVYAAAALVAPTTAGTYIVVWDNAGTRAAEELVVTATLAADVESSGTILTLAEYKMRRKIIEVSAPRDEAITAALVSAEDAVLQYTGRDFTTATAVETREFPWEAHTMVLETDDFVGKPTGIEFEVPGVGAGSAFPTNVYWLGPREGATHYYIDFTPSKNLSMTSIGQMGFTRNLDTVFGSSGGVDYVNVKVTAEFGWPGAAPASVKQAVTWLVDEFRKSEGTQGDVQAEAIANLSYVYQRISEENTLPARVTTLLDPYRRLAL